MAPEEISFAINSFRQLNSGHRPIVTKELPGFVGYQLAYILFKEKSKTEVSNSG
jgi:hypothetical protein